MKKRFLPTILICASVCAQQQPAGPEVLETFPPGFSSRATKLRAARHSQHSDNEVIRLARDYAQQGRALGDPRSIRLAASLLEPLSVQINPAAEVLVLLAGLKSYEHDFTSSLKLLDRALVADGSSVEGLVQKISTLITLGRFSDARRTFGTNPALLGDARGIVLLAQLSSLTGQLKASYSLLERHIGINTTASPEEGAWRLGILAEMAERMGDSSAAEEHYLKGLASIRASGLSDIYLANAWMDLLIGQKRYPEAVAFASDSPLGDRLLLRKVIASPATPPGVLEQQFFQSERHHREQSLFLLKIKHDVSGALRYALKNWQSQKEPIDVRLVIESAAAAGDLREAEPVLAWIKENRYEDARLAPLLNEERQR